MLVRRNSPSTMIGRLCRDLFGDDFANRVILRLLEFGFARLTLTVLGEGVFHRLRPQQAAYQIHAHGLEIVF
jgi:hypothetical protein